MLLILKSDFGATWAYYDIFLANGVSVTGFRDLEHVLLLEYGPFGVLVAECLVFTTSRTVQVFQLLLMIEVRNKGAILVRIIIACLVLG